jgi:hypothetical protein
MFVQKNKSVGIDCYTGYKTDMTTIQILSYSFHNNNNKTKWDVKFVNHRYKKKLSATVNVQLYTFQSYTTNPHLTQEYSA